MAEGNLRTFAKIHTLNPGLATNLHFELLRGVLQNYGEYKRLEHHISKIGEFLSQTIVIHRCYIPLEELFNRKRQRWN